MPNDPNYLTGAQERALSKLTSKWVTAASIDEFLFVLDFLAKKGYVDCKFTHYQVLWRKRNERKSA